MKYTFENLINIIATLRAPGGCPWDQEQTHESLKVSLKEESQEVLDAIDHQDMENLCEELGDLLLQVLLHSQIAKEQGDFSIDDVVDGLCNKMIRRHPYVFSDVTITSKEEAEEWWNEIKRQEKWKKT